MRQKQKAGSASSKVPAHCAACASPISEGDHVGYCVIPVGLTFAGRMIGEKLVICSGCLARAKSSSAGEAQVNAEIVARYHGPDDGNGQAEEEMKVLSAERWVH